MNIETSFVNQLDEVNQIIPSLKIVLQRIDILSRKFLKTSE